MGPILGQEKKIIKHLRVQSVTNEHCLHVTFPNLAIDNKRVRLESDRSVESICVQRTSSTSSSEKNFVQVQFAQIATLVIK
jgi:hypothetical protein